MFDKKIRDWQKLSTYGDYLIERFLSSHYLHIDDSKNIIELGNQYFKLADGMKKAEWFNALATYYLRQGKNRVKALHLREQALSLAQNCPNASYVGYRACLGVGELMSVVGNFGKAKMFAQRACQDAIWLGFLPAQARAMHLEANCCSSLGDFQEADKLYCMASDLLKSCGIQGGWHFLAIHIDMADMYIQKTEYVKCRGVLELIHSLVHAKSTNYNTAIYYMNLAHLGIMTGAKPELVYNNLNISSETALGLFQVALKDFRSMGVPHWRGVCMVHMDIIKHSGQIDTATNFWRAEKPLFEEYLQMGDITKEDAKLKVVQ
ncbi:hypothetical protein B0H10DRAFT_1948171 [Mycena sp. CBHHK59/15]|nr:hypothetical protein B0H10DRAFT_1948171 [Mycena sp. CBHHK59/15]